MSLRKLLWTKGLLLAGLLFSTASAQAQHGLFHSRGGACKDCAPSATAPWTVNPAPAVVNPAPSAASPSPAAPSPAPISQPATVDLAFNAPVSTAGLGDFASIPAQGYIDSARPFTNFRLRVDSAYNNNRPDRAEFFYPKCGCFRVAGVDPSASGPPLPETSVDYQDIWAYAEWAPSNRFSVFADVPWRFINPEQNSNANGIGDIHLGFKYAFIADGCQYLSFQLRTYVPTGDGFRGLGTDHVSLEPAILYYNQVNENVSIFGEFRDWIPIGGTDFAGNVIRYGLGAGYTLNARSSTTITPTVEVVGWTVLNGGESSIEVPIQDASGDTIINGKLGVRFGLGERSSFYAGYGRALTGEVWYKDTFRLEYRLAF